MTRGPGADAGNGHETASSSGTIPQDLGVVVKAWNAFYPDGWYKEMCTPYSVSVARQLQYLAAALCDTDEIAAMRDNFKPMVTSLAGLSNPRGVVPTFGDNNLSNVKIEFDGETTIATAPNEAKLLLVPLTGGLKPQLTIGDKAPHTTCFYDGTPRTEKWGEKGRKNSHGRGWTAHRMQYLMPAPAVTYVGDAKLPAMLTMAMVPLAPGQSRDDVPTITSRQGQDATTWTLPLAEGQLQFTTSAESCQIEKSKGQR